ncbi:MAG: glycine cleavage system protein GcvH [Candidatus Chloroheliales bacterium]|nr:MAG: glycine cleavage system protein GcvH [Chloroflexota bacterium]
MPNNPTDLKYSESHEWVKLDGGEATLGVTAYAVEHLGDMVYAEFPNPGTILNAGDVAGTLESVKAAADLFTPVGGTVIAKNDAVEGDPALLNRDPYGAWLLKLTLSDPSQLDKLMDAVTYDAYEASQ